MKKIEKSYVKSHVKKGDQVKVISGEQKGFLGIINSVVKKKSSVILEGIVPRVKYLKNPQGQGEAKKIELPILIHVSNVMLWDKQANKPSRIGYKESSTSANTSDKKRYFKKSGNLI